MSTSQVHELRQLYQRHGTRMLWTAAAVAAFGGIYEHFSFGVWSGWMVYAFFPFLLGGLWLLRLSRRQAPPGQLFLALLEPGLFMLTLGSICWGVVEIYGTENRLLPVLPIVGGLLTLSALGTRIAAARWSAKMTQ